ncbi:hypothetical protein GCM10023339_46470 [Alloalcanivorax gelatiniphagus]
MPKRGPLVMAGIPTAVVHATNPDPALAIRVAMTDPAVAALSLAGSAVLVLVISLGGTLAAADMLRIGRRSRGSAERDVDTQDAQSDSRN